MSKPSSGDMKCSSLIHIHTPITAEVMMRELDQWNHPKLTECSCRVPVERPEMISEIFIYK